MTSGQFWWLILIISIGCGFWATVGVLERLLKGLNAHRELMHADARDQLAELREISSALSDIRYMIGQHVEPNAMEETLARLQDIAAGKAGLEPLKAPERSSAAAQSSQKAATVRPPTCIVLG